jgi:hypothetical protein
LKLCMHLFLFGVGCYSETLCMVLTGPAKYCHVDVWTGVHHGAVFWCYSLARNGTSDVTIVILTFYTGDHVTRLVLSHIAMCTYVIVGVISAFRRRRCQKQVAYLTLINVSRNDALLHVKPIVHMKSFRTYKYSMMCVLLTKLNNVQMCTQYLFPKFGRS